MMDKPQKVTAYLKVTAEFYDPEATPETVRACVEQDLEDAGYDVEVVQIGKHNNSYCKLVPGVAPHPPGCADDRDYKQDYLDFVNLVTFSHFKKEKFQEPPSYPVAKAAWNVFGPSYRYRQQYNEYKAKRMAAEKQIDGQETLWEE